MEKKEFGGNLKNIYPKKIINTVESDEIQNFFLILGMIFNDLKGLIFFQKMIEDTYRRPEAEEISVQMGEWSGLINQINKYLISTVAEFLIFIEKNKKIFGSIRFKLLLKKLKKDELVAWNKLIDLNDDESDATLSNIARIRSNIVFHFDHSSSELRKGFIRSFFKEAKDMPQHKLAYYSIEPTMEKTRIYYSDAAVGEYIKSLMSNEEIGDVRVIIEKMNMVIKALLGVYHDTIQKKK